MNILNKGRCSRCLASKKGGSIVIDKTEIMKTWLFCVKYKKFCSCIAGFLCKEPPMGISADDYTKLNRGEK
jgi:hypothetical protein